MYPEKPDPFRESAGKEMPMAYGNEMYNFSKFLIDDKSLPDYIRQFFWAFSDKELSITNLSERDIKSILAEFDDAVLAYLMSIPEWEHGFDAELALTEMRTKIKIKLKRSQGGYERKMLATQVRQMIYSEDNAGQPRTGIMGKIFGRR